MSDFIIAVGHTSGGNIGWGVVDRLDGKNCTREIRAFVEKCLKEKEDGVYNEEIIACWLVGADVYSNSE